MKLKIADTSTVSYLDEVDTTHGKSNLCVEEISSDGRMILKLTKQ